MPTLQKLLKSAKFTVFSEISTNKKIYVFTKFVNNAIYIYILCKTESISSGIKKGHFSHFSQNWRISIEIGILSIRPREAFP